MADEPRLSKSQAAPLSELEVLKRQDAFKTQLLNSVAHELSTPLTPIRLQLHFIMEGRHGGLTVEQQKSMEVVRRNVDRLHGLVKDLLDISRLESSRMTIQMKPIDLADIVSESLETYKGAAEEAGMRLETEISRGLIILADQQRLVQVVHNLLSNAIRFTPPGGMIKVRVDRHGDQGRVTVSDSGTGFSMDESRKLFKPFSQLGNPVEGAYRGSGLGLYISQGIVLLHKGEISGSSAGPGKGAVFGFHVPLAAKTSAVENVIPVISVGAEGGREEDFSRRIRNLV